MRHASVLEEIIHSYRVKARPKVLKDMEALVSEPPLARNSISRRAAEVRADRDHKGPREMMQLANYTRTVP